MRRLALMLAAVLTLSGCAGWTDASDPGAVVADDEWESYQPIVTEQPVEEPEPEPEYPAAFSLPYHKGVTLDPVDCGEGIQEAVASLLYEPLFRLNEKFQPEPLLCGSWTWDEAGLVCTLALQEGAAFSDGSPVTARDVVETLLRAKASERYAYRLRNVAAVTANRAGQVLITLTAPNRGLPALLDIPIVKRTTAGEMVPTGSGPYILEDSADGVCLRAREDWWQGKPLPVDVIPLVHGKDMETALHLFSSRRIELLAVDPTDDPSLVTGKAQTTSQPTSILQFIGFNTAEGRLFSNAALRALFSQGIDRGTLVHAQLVQLALGTQFPISPLSALYPKEAEKPFNEEEFLSALRAAGQDSGEAKELKLLVSGGDAFRSTSARFIAEHLSVLDWRITIEELPWEEYMAALEAGEFDLYFGEVRLTADWDLTDLIGTEGLLNYGGYSDENTDMLLQAFAAAEDRTAFAQRLGTHLQAYMPIAPVCFKNHSILTHPGIVEGISPVPGYIFYGLEGWTVHIENNEDAPEETPEADDE